MNGEYYYAINGSIQYMESAADFDRKPRSDNVALFPRTSRKTIADERKVTLDSFLRVSGLKLKHARKLGFALMLL